MGLEGWDRGPEILTTGKTGEGLGWLVLESLGADSQKQQYYIFVHNICFAHCPNISWDNVLWNPQAQYMCFDYFCMPTP